MPGLILIAAILTASSVTVAELPPYVASEPEVDSRPMPVPDGLPVPPEFVRAPESRIAEPVEIAPPAPRLMQSFLALEDDNSSIPPDTMGAAGPNHLVTVLNTQWRAQARNGAILHTVSTRTFFNSVRNGNRVFDPRIVYDPRANRWILCAVSDGRTSSEPKHPNSALLLGVSRTSDPLGTWDLYRYESLSDVWLDFPQLGFDDETIVISNNTYSQSDDRFVRSTFFVIDRDAPGTAFTRIDYAGNGGTHAPTVSMDPGNRTYLVQRWNGNFQNAGYIRLYSITAAGVTPISFLSSPTAWANSGGSGDFAPQSGRSDRIDAGDDRMQYAVLRNGHIWATQATFYPAGTPNRGAINWWRLTTTGVVVERGTIEDPTGAVHYVYPSIAVNRRGEALIGASRFSAATHASAVYVFVQPGAVPVVFKSGEASYYKVGTGTRNRWGDYSATAVDPVNDTDFWTVQEYAATPTTSFDRWGTWWAQVTTTSSSKRRGVRH